MLNQYVRVYVNKCQVPGSLPLDLFPLNLFVFVVLVAGKDYREPNSLSVACAPAVWLQIRGPCVPSNATRIGGKAMA